MKKLFTIAVFALCGVSSFAQTPICVADTAYVSQGVGVYPKPDSTCAAPCTAVSCPRTNLMQIERSMPVSMVFTAVVPNTIDPGTGPIAITKIGISNVGIINPAGGASLPLPMGLSYQCSPSSCEFPANTNGCVVLLGTTNDPVGFYPLEVSATVYNSFGLTIPINFPNTLIPSAAGCYMLQIIEPVTIRENISSYISCKPNPTSSLATLGFNHHASGSGTITILNVNGQEVSNQKVEYKQGNNELGIDLSALTNGVYFYKVNCGDVTFVNKLIINK